MLPTSAAAGDLIGQVIEARYRVLALIGTGGMGAVYEVEHVLVGRHFALKTLYGDAAKNPNVVARFYREARAAAAIGDEHIIEVSDMGHLPDGAPYIVMELVEGKNLGDLLAAEGALPVGRAVRIALQCCNALGLAHARGIVHRDIKPDNIFLTHRRQDPDFVKLLDFGISKVQQAIAGIDPAVSALTSTGMMIGTPFYMSPEQLGEGEVDARADIYALGVVLYKMLTGEVPFNAGTYSALMLKILQQKPLPVSELRPEVPAALSEAIDKALAKRADDRFFDVQEMAKALRPFLSARRGSRDTEREGPSSRPPPAALETSTVKERNRSKSVASRIGQALSRWDSMPPLPKSKAALWTVAGTALTALVAIGLWSMSVSETAGPAEPEHIVQPAPEAPVAVAAAASRETEPATKMPTTAPAQGGTAEQPSTAQAPLPEGVSKEARTGHLSRPRADRREVRQRTTHSPVPSERRLEPTPPPAEEPQRAVVPPNLFEPDAWRVVVLQNTRRAAVDVRLACGGASVNVSLFAGATKQAKIPQGDCKVTCTGLGQPNCPGQLSSATRSLQVQ